MLPWFQPRLRPALALACWSSENFELSFNPETGQHWRHLVLTNHTPPSQLSGTGVVERTLEHERLFFCLYKWAGRLVFRAGRLEWRLDEPDLAFSFEAADPDARSSVFVVRSDGTAAFRCTYRHAIRTGLARIDPARSLTDFEDDHFLYYVASLSLPQLGTDSVWADGMDVLQRGGPLTSS